MEQNSSIPQWDLTSIWPGLDSAEYKQALADYSASLEELEKIQSAADTIAQTDGKRFDVAKWLATRCPVANRAGALGASLGAYAYSLYATETTNAAYLANISRLEELDLRANRIHVAFLQTLRRHKAGLPDFYRRFPQFEQYQSVLERELYEAEHQMPAEQEDLACDMQRSGGNAWSRLQEQIISNMADSQSGRTFNELRNDAFSADARLRFESYQKELALLEQNRIPLAACLSSIKGETITLSKRRGWSSALDRALSGSRINRKSLEAMLSAIEESLPDWRAYLQAKAALLARTGQTVNREAGGIAFYDLFAPVGSTAEQKAWGFDEARDYIVRKFSAFSAEMGDFARQAFDSCWIDARVRAGKTGGAFDEDFPLQKESRVLSNFTGTFSDVITLAHELGHAYHFRCVLGNDFALQDYPMTLAESASTFAETLVKQDLIARSDGAGKLAVLELDLQDACQILVDILSRYYFETEVFARRAEGELGAEDLCHLMKAAQDKSYGEGLGSAKHPYMWAVKSHYYIPDLDFYNFPYAFGQLFAAGLYRRYQAEGAAFAKAYTELLSQTGRLDCEDLCLRAGFDITAPDFWKSGIALYKEEIAQFLSLAEKA